MLTGDTDPRLATEKILASALVTSDQNGRTGLTADHSARKLRMGC